MDAPGRAIASTGMPRMLIAAGVILIVLGVLWQAGVPFGRLPGDITIRRGTTTVYVPMATCIVVSLLLTLLASFLRR